jgi:integrase
VVLRYRLELESRHLDASTITLRLAAVRRLAYEAADTGILSPELAAGIQRVKGAKRLGVRLGNWLTVEECRAVLAAPDVTTLTGCRDRAMLSLLFGCGLRRAELVALELRDLQRRGITGSSSISEGREAHSHRSSAGLGAGCGSGRYARAHHDSPLGPALPAGIREALEQTRSSDWRILAHGRDLYKGSRTMGRVFVFETEEFEVVRVRFAPTSRPANGKTCC